MPPLERPTVPEDHETASLPRRGPRPAAVTLMPSSAAATPPPSSSGNRACLPRAARTRGRMPAGASASSMPRHPRAVRRRPRSLSAFAGSPRASRQRLTLGHIEVEASRVRHDEENGRGRAYLRPTGERSSSKAKWCWCPTLETSTFVQSQAVAFTSGYLRPMDASLARHRQGRVPVSPPSRTRLGYAPARW